MRCALVMLLVLGCAAKKAPPQDPLSNTSPTGGGNSTMQPGPRPSTGGAGDDRDGDGILDRVDQCADDPEDYDGFTDEDGCPDPDNDGDGILDVDDLCPNDPENRNGNQDEDGCPD